MGNEQGNGNEDVLELLERKRAETEQLLTRINAAIVALHGGESAMERKGISRRTGGVVPPIVDIVRYLTQAGKPVHQNEIMAKVGEIRHSRYPSLNYHYSGIWRALEFHVRKNKLISCVDEDGRPAKLKPLPERPIARRLPNVPELYEAENWFWLKEEMAEGRHVKSERALEAGQD